MKRYKEYDPEKMRALYQKPKNDSESNNVPNKPAFNPFEGLTQNDIAQYKREYKRDISKLRKNPTHLKVYDSIVVLPNEWYKIDSSDSIHNNVLVLLCISKKLLKPCGFEWEWQKSKDDCVLCLAVEADGKTLCFSSSYDTTTFNWLLKHYKKKFKYPLNKLKDLGYTVKETIADGW